MSEDDAIDLGVRPGATGLTRQRRRRLTLAVLVLAALVGAFLVRPDRDAPVESASEQGSDDLSEAVVSFDPRFRDASPATTSSSTSAPKSDDPVTSTPGSDPDPVHVTGSAPAGTAEASTTTTTGSAFEGREWIDQADRPVLIGVEVDPEIAEAGTTIALSWRLLSRDGIVSTTFAMFDRAGRAVSWAGCPQGAPAPRIQGDRHDGWYGVTCATPATAEPGEYWLAVEAEDVLGQQGSWREVWPLTLLTPDDGTTTTTTSTTTAPAGPTLVSSSVSTTSASRGETVTVTWRFRSTPGLVFATFFISSPEHGSATSPQCHTGSAVARSSGDGHDGTYTASCTLSSSLPLGRYNVAVFGQDAMDDVTQRQIGHLDVTAGP